MHRYNNISTFFQSIGVHNSPNSLDTKYTVSYKNSLNWFLGMKFDWLETDNALKYYVHQEVFILDIIKCYNLMDCNKQIFGDLNWLSIFTCPDITNIMSLLAAHTQPFTCSNQNI